MKSAAFLRCILLLMALAVPVYARQDDDSADHDASHLLRVPPGFEVTIYAEGQNFDGPTQITFGPDGHLYVLSLSGSIYRLIDEDSDHYAETVELAFEDGNLNQINEENVEQAAQRSDQLYHAVGFVFVDDALYVSDSGRISRLEDQDGDGVFETLTPVVERLVSLHYSGHSNNGIALGPDGKLYVGVGATSDHGPLRQPMEASVLRVNPDGTDLEVFATGLRNPYDLVFSPEGDLFTTDNNPTEIDRTLRYVPPEELNHIRQGEDYGFPQVFGHPPPGHDSTGPVVEFYPSVTSAGIDYYASGPFPAGWREGVYVAQWGTGAPAMVNRDLEFGFAVVFVPLEKDDAGRYTGDFVEFAASATERAADFSPIDVTVGPDGALYIVEFFTSRVFRVAYTGTARLNDAEPVATAQPLPEPVPGALVRGETLFFNGALNAPACIVCHRMEGDTNSLGPSLRGLHEVAGSRVPGLSAADYVRQSILHPRAYIVPGYQPYMPQTYREALEEDEIDALVAFVLTLDLED